MSATSLMIQLEMKGLTAKEGLQHPLTGAQQHSSG
jgi:hypothetical protein